MKKILLTVVALGLAVTVFGQGQAVFNNKVGTTVVAPVYGPETSDANAVIQGNTITGVPVGNKTYNSSVAVIGTGFTAQLWALNGSVYEPLTPTATFKTTTNPNLYGYVQAPAAAVVVPFVAPQASATLIMRAWENKGGTITSWAQVNETGNFSVLRGESLPFEVVLGGGTAPAANLVGLQSFNLHTVIPEPSVIALGVLGIGALVLFRRRK